MKPDTFMSADNDTEQLNKLRFNELVHLKASKYALKMGFVLAQSICVKGSYKNGIILEDKGLTCKFNTEFY